jgi:hypothetical protein
MSRLAMVHRLFIVPLNHIEYLCRGPDLLL